MNLAARPCLCMVREFILGNGQLAAAWDSNFVLRDLCWPGAGGPNHLNGRAIQCGIAIDGQFVWLADCVVAGTARSLDSGRALSFRFASSVPSFALAATARLSPTAPELILELSLESWSGTSCRFFLTEALCINENDIGDTTLYHEDSNSTIHFGKGRGFQFSADVGASQSLGYSCGLKDFGEFEGTFRDAEDGKLSQNPIAQGSVDSTLSIDLPSQNAATVRFLIRALENPLTFGLPPDPNVVTLWDEAARFDGTKGEALAALVESRFSQLPDKVRALCACSVSILLAHGNESGAIVASIDSSIMSTNRAHYRYCWMRDGANICMSLLDLGISEPMTRFLAFCDSVLNPNWPAFLQKYDSQAHFGATWHPWLEPGVPPIQEDETALVVLAACNAWNAKAISQELALGLIEPLAGFLCDFTDEEGLPLPSYDLWEERKGIHVQTLATVIAALVEASLVLENKNSKLANNCRAAAERMKEAVDRRFLASGAYGIPRCLDTQGKPDMTLDSAILSLIEYRIVPAGSILARELIDRVQEGLQIRGSVGGLARYAGDYYFRRTENEPGNPWIITTMWLVHAMARSADSPEAIEKARKHLDWAAEMASSSGSLAEQYCAVTGSPLAVRPLAWSHAEFLKAALEISKVLDRSEN